MVRLLPTTPSTVLILSPLVSFGEALDTGSG